MRDRTLQPAAAHVKPSILPAEEPPEWASIPDDFEPCPLRKDAPNDRSIGGTTISAILGASPKRTPWDVWIQLTGRITPDLTAAAPSYFEWGNRHEPTILGKYAEDINPRTLRCATSFRHRTAPFLRVSPDALTAPSTIVEVKTARWRGPEWGEDGSDGVPAAYLLQVSWYCHFLRREGWDLAALFGGSDFALFHGAYDSELGAYLEEEARKFWRDHVLADKPPDPESGALVSRYLSDRFPRALSTTLEPATVAVTALARELAGWKLAEKYVERRKEEAENALKLNIGSGAGFAGDGFKVRWSDVKTKRTDWKAAFQALVEKFNIESTQARDAVDFATSQTEYRRFTLHTTAEEQARSIEAINPRLQLPPSFVGDEKE